MQSSLDLILINFHLDLILINFRLDLILIIFHFDLILIIFCFDLIMIIFPFDLILINFRFGLILITSFWPIIEQKSSNKDLATNGLTVSFVLQSKKMKIEVLPTERALIGYLLAKIHKLDPDLIVVSTFTLSQL